MSKPTNSPLDLLVDQIRSVVREEIVAVLKSADKPMKDCLQAEELAALYGLHKTWFRKRGCAGDIARTKPSRYVLFACRDVEAYLEMNKRST